MMETEGCILLKIIFSGIPVPKELAGYNSGPGVHRGGKEVSTTYGASSTEFLRAGIIDGKTLSPIYPISATCPPCPRPAQTTLGIFRGKPAIPLCLKGETAYARAPGVATGSTAGNKPPILFPGRIPAIRIFSSKR